MRAGRAWCVELQRTVSVVEAQAAYFDQPEPRRRLTFQCADPICRERTHAKLAGVHDDRLFIDDAFPTSAHFAMIPQSPHDPNCESMLRDRAAEMVAREADRARADLNASRRFSSKRPFEVFDVYRPAITDAASSSGDAAAPSTPDAEPESGNTTPLTAWDDEFDADRRISEIAQEMRTRSLRTRRLLDVVSCFTELGPVDRQKALIHLPGGRPMSYASFIQPISKYQETGVPVVRVGGARVAHRDDGFVLRFHDRVVLNGERHELLLFLADDRIAASPISGLLRAQLIAALGDGCHARVFFFGGILADAGANHVAQIRLTDLDNLVVHPIRVGRGETAAGRSTSLAGS